MHLNAQPPQPDTRIRSGADAPYADAERLLAEIWHSRFAPPDPISVADFAAQHRWLNNEGGGYVGRWSHAIAPYLVEPMEALTDPAHLTVAIVKPGQCGGTAIAENWLLHAVSAAPADMLWYMPTEPLVANYVKTRINPMVDTHAAMKGRRGKGPADNSLGYKGFGAMSVQFLAAAHSNLISKSAPRIVVDEIDAFPPTLGDPMTLINVRRQTYGRESKVLVLSHPDRARAVRPREWTAGVMALYADSTRCTWWWPCPHCGCWSSPNPTAARHMRLDYPEEGSLDAIADAARLVCPVNGCLIEDERRREMNLRGCWIGAGETIDEAGEVTGARLRHDTAGYWIVGPMSPFILGGIGGLARARVKAEREREGSGDDAAVRQVMVKQWGIPYAPPRDVAGLDAAALAERADAALKLGEVPDGVRFLTAAVDVQANRFELLVRGWGEGGRSWVVAAERIAADPAASAEDWDKLLERLLDLAYPVALPRRKPGAMEGHASDELAPAFAGAQARLRVRACGFDTGGSPGVTQQAYAAWRRFRVSRRIKFLGMVSGRDVYPVMPLKGVSGPNAAPLQVVYPDHKRKDRTARAAGVVPLALFNTNAAKDDVAGQLAVADGGPWSVAFPAALRAQAGWFDQLCAEARGRDGKWQKVASAARNEALDLMVMTHVLARLHGLSRIDWTRPPPWARHPGEGNTMIETHKPVEAMCGPEPRATAAPAQPVPAAIAAGKSSGLRANLARMG